MTNMSMNDDVPSLYEQLIHYPGQRVLIMTKMTPKEILDFYKYTASRKGNIYRQVALELEEESIVQHYLNGTLTEEMLSPMKEPTPEETQEIEDVANLVAERQKQRTSAAYRLYRKIVPFNNKKLK